MKFNNVRTKEFRTQHRITWTIVDDDIRKALQNGKILFDYLNSFEYECLELEETRKKIIKWYKKKRGLLLLTIEIQGDIYKICEFSGSNLLFDGYWDLPLDIKAHSYDKCFRCLEAKGEQ